MILAGFLWSFQSHILGSPFPCPKSAFALFFPPRRPCWKPKLRRNRLPCWCCWNPPCFSVQRYLGTRGSRCGPRTDREMSKSWESPMNRWVVGTFLMYLDCLYLGLSPLPVAVTTRIITCLVGDPYKPSFATVTGRGTTQIIPMILWLSIFIRINGYYPFDNSIHDR